MIARSIPTLLALTLSWAISARDVAAQDRPVAFVNARLLTMEGTPIDGGTLLVRDGLIAEIGTDVEVPAGAVVVDLKGGAIMPGLVSAWSRAGLQAPRPPRQTVVIRPGRGRIRGPRTPRTSSRSANTAAQKVTLSLYPKQKVFRQLLESGVTTLSLAPNGRGFPGTGAILDPRGTTRAELTVDDDAFLLVSVTRNKAAKKTLKDGFAKAAKVVEERTKPKPPAPKEGEKKPEAKKPEPKDGEKKTGEPKPGDGPKPKPEAKKQEPEAKKPQAKPKTPPKPKKDPNVEVLADLLQGSKRALLEIGSASDMLHYLDAVGAEVKYPKTVVVPRHDSNSGTIDLVLDQLKTLEAKRVLLSTSTATMARTRYLINPAAQLHEAGLEVGFVLGENRQTVEGLFFALMELVRLGLPADIALKGVTLVPAKALGVDAEVGSLKQGKKANLLLFGGDPLDPSSRLQAVYYEGREVKKGADQ